MTDALIEQAEVLKQRIDDNPDFKVMLDITHKTQKQSVFNTIYSIFLTLLVIIMGIIAFNTWHNSNVIDRLRSTCEQGNKDKAADLASWKTILSLFPTGSDQIVTTIISSREVVDTPVDC